MPGNCPLALLERVIEFLAVLGFPLAIAKLRLAVGAGRVR
jgi:hypothetical protein